MCIRDSLCNVSQMRHIGKVPFGYGDGRFLNLAGPYRTDTAPGSSPVSYTHLEGLCLVDNDVRDKIITVLCVSDIHAVCTPFIGSLCGKLLTGTNTPFAMSSARMAAFLASISAFFRFLILSSYRFCAPLAFRFK